LASRSLVLKSAACYRSRGRTNVLNHKKEFQPRMDTNIHEWEQETEHRHVEIQKGIRVHSWLKFLFGEFYRRWNLRFPRLVDTLHLSLEAVDGDSRFARLPNGSHPRRVCPALDSQQRLSVVFSALAFKLLPGGLPAGTAKSEFQRAAQVASVAIGVSCWNKSCRIAEILLQS
jgi:hypothetical protein